MLLPKLVYNREVVVLVIYAFIAALALVGPGSHTGYSAIALPSLSTTNHSGITLTEAQIPLFASLPIITQILGSFVSILTLKRGRRVAIAVGSLVCSIGWIVIAFSNNIPVLFLGRLLIGLSAGMCTTPSTVYLSEISKTKWRAILTPCSSLFISLGIVLVYLLGFLYRDNWQRVATICIIVPTVSAICAILFLPESPSWLLIMNRVDDARNSLLRIRGLSEETPAFQEEFANLTKYIETGKQASQIDEFPEGTPLVTVIWKIFTHYLNVLTYPEVWKPFLILCCFFFFQQFSGIYVMVTYAVDMIVKAGVKVDPFLVTVIVGLLEASAEMISLIFSARIGRRPIAIISGVGMSVSLGILGVYKQFFENISVTTVPLACILFFVGTGSFGFMLLPWAMTGELFPTGYVHILGPLTISCAEVMNFATVQLYPAMAKYGVVMVFFYCFVATLATVFVVLVLPETRGKTRTEIEDRFRRRVSSRL